MFQKTFTKTVTTTHKKFEFHSKIFTKRGAQKKTDNHKTKLSNATINHSIIKPQYWKVWRTYPYGIASTLLFPLKTSCGVIYTSDDNKVT